jgi:hypothetical protein
MNHAKDMGERALATFVQAFLASLSVASLVDTGMSGFDSALLAGAAAVLSLIKGWAAQAVGDPNSASLIRG